LPSPAAATSINEGKSDASFSQQVAAWFPDTFCNFHLVKNHKVADQPLKLEKNKHRFGILRILDIFMYV
jgi:hypothetical protein